MSDGEPSASQAELALECERAVRALAQGEAQGADAAYTPGRAIALLLRALAVQERQGADRLAAALTTWFAAAGVKTTELDEASTLAWQWLRQILPLRTQLPPAILAAVAHGIQAGDFARSRPLLDAEYKIARRSTIEALDVLRRHAPEIEVMVDPFRFETVSPEQAAEVVDDERNSGTYLIRALMKLLRLEGMLRRIGLGKEFQQPEADGRPDDASR